MRWHPLPPEPTAWLVSGVDDLGLKVHERYIMKDTAICRRDEIQRHGGRAVIGRVIGDAPVTPQILGTSPTIEEGD